MLQKTGKRGPFLSCSGYPDCKTTMNITDGRRAGGDGAADRVQVREVRQGHGAADRPARAVFGVQRLPACKNAKDVDDQGKPVVQQTAGIDCPDVQKPDGGEARPARPRSSDARRTRSAARRCR